MPPKPPKKPSLRRLRHPTAAAVSNSDLLTSSSAVSTITALVLSHTGPARTLTPLLPHPIPPPLTNLVLKRLWNDAPKALLFFHALPSPPPSSLPLALSLAARLRDAATVSRLLSLHRPFLSPLPFAVLMERHAAHGKPDQAVRVFLSMHRHGCGQDLSSFNTLLDVLCKSGCVRKACGLVKVFRRRFRPDVVTYNVIADGWCRVKETGKALGVLKEMVESGVEPTIVSYNIVLKGYFRAGQVNEAWRFFKEMKRRGRENKMGCAPDVVSYTTVVHGLGVAGEIDRARKVFDEMPDKTVPAYNAFIQVLCKKDCVRNAVGVFEEMVARALVPNVVTYNIVVRGLCHSGDMDGAVAFIGRMRQAGCGLNVQTYNILIKYWSENGEIGRCMDLLNEMVKGGDCLPNMDTYDVLIKAMFVRKRPEDMLMAGNLVVEMLGRGHVPRRFVFNRVLNGLLITGNQEVARDLLRAQDSCRRLRREIKL